MNIDFDPSYFLRCHSKNKDNADVQTQVWDCAFQPDMFDDEVYIVATCGGNSVCFIDCLSGTTVAKYYTKHPSIFLFTLAWTSIPSRERNGRRSILVAGGAQSTLYFIDFSRKKFLLEHSLMGKRNTAIHALKFHPTEKQILFCGTSIGEIIISELQRNFSDTRESFLYHTIKIIQVGSEIFDFAFCMTTKYLLASSNDGLITCSFPTKESLRSTAMDKTVWIELVNGVRQTKSSLVDSVETLKDGLVACKYALHSSIYVFDLKQLKFALNCNVDITTFEIEPLYILNWSPTDNYFIYMDVNVDCSLLCCGDDTGSLWMYETSSLVDRTATKHVNPSAIIPWPHLTDHYNDKKRKLNLDVYDIVVDKVAVHSSGKYIVAVTNNNLVCIWKKV